MKTLFFLLTGLLSASIHAQIVTLRFENSSNNYEVKVDGRSYYSKDVSNNTGKQRTLTINDLTTGTHRLDVYSITDNNSNNGTSMYSNTFQLREGYDLVIAIKRNEEVAFIERGSINTTPQRNPISETEFDKLQKSVSAKWSESARFTAAKTAINTPTNYFTTEQVGQLVSLLKAEANKIELAKLAYPKVTDANNFSEINSLFNSQASRDEMEKYISSRSHTVVTNNDPYTTRPAISNSQFNSLVRTVQNQYQQEGKVAVLTDAFNNKDEYFSASQLQKLISLVTAENNRLSLAKLSYARVSDISNFSSLNNLFTKQSSRDELNYFVKYGVNPASTETYTNRTPMTDAEFRKLLQKASLHFRQSSVVGDVKAAFNSTTNYYTIAQIRSLLGLVSAESDRLTLAKLAYHRATEPQAFTQLFDLFSTEVGKNDLSNYINSVAVKQ
ncbi:MAG TPA: DUF4476 domain-containing protein [Flavitalea sp.]|nr:DUF4476 domain-containing protein [Flavitalea sp.]